MIYKCIKVFSVSQKFLFSATGYLEDYLSGNFILKFIMMWLLCCGMCIVRIATPAVRQGHVIKVAGKHGSVPSLLHRPVQILSCYKQFIPDIRSAQGMRSGNFFSLADVD